MVNQDQKYSNFCLDNFFLQAVFILCCSERSFLYHNGGSAGREMNEVEISIFWQDENEIDTLNAPQHQYLPQHPGWLSRAEDLL